ncbi:MAG TPA: Fic family protein [Candidatus Baltobacteraceae bacterium]
MDGQRRFELAAAGLEIDSRRLLELNSRGSVQTELAALVFEEIEASTRLAGSALRKRELHALIEQGRALGDHRYDDYVLAAGYADAAGYVAAQAPLTERKIRPYLRIEEIVDVHLRATRGVSDLTARRWRRRTLPAFPNGVVPPPPWQVPGEIRAFVDRVAVGPPGQTPPILWVASALERFTRLQPFDGANGRVGRLVINLLLRRLGLPPFIVPANGAAYRDALQRADADGPWTLAAVIAKSVGDGMARLRGAVEDEQPLQSLRAIAPAAELTALYKAAQRGRLRTLRRGGELLTTQAWLRAYRASRSHAGRKARI